MGGVEVAVVDAAQRPADAAPDGGEAVGGADADGDEQQDEEAVEPDGAEDLEEVGAAHDVGEGAVAVALELEPGVVGGGVEADGVGDLGEDDAEQGGEGDDAELGDGEAD